MFCISHTADAFTIKGDCASCSAYSRSPFHAPLNKGICLSDVVTTCPCDSHLRRRKSQSLCVVALELSSKAHQCKAVSHRGDNNKPHSRIFPVLGVDKPELLGSQK